LVANKVEFLIEVAEKTAGEPRDYIWFGKQKEKAAKVLMIKFALCSIFYFYVTILIYFRRDADFSGQYLHSGDGDSCTWQRRTKPGLQVFQVRSLVLSCP
jgi:hypothetical protein